MAAAIASLAVWFALVARSDAENPSVHAVAGADAAAPRRDTPPTALAERAMAISVPTADPSAGTAPFVAGLATRQSVEGLKIASQSWRRGGLGSKALVTLTLRNANDYAVKDIEIACAFTRRDGSHLTGRKRVIDDIINRRSRKTYRQMHVGFVNINANKAKCSLVAASRV